jgi:hypothetical protein
VGLIAPTTAPEQLFLLRFCTNDRYPCTADPDGEHRGIRIFLTHNAPPHIKIEGMTHSVNTPPFKPGEVKQLAYSIMTDRQTADFQGRSSSAKMNRLTADWRGW